MPTYVALLRAVNVGGTGKLAMADLRQICADAGFRGVRTYIASGNVVFASDETAVLAKATLETALAAFAGRPIGVLLRTAAEMAGVASANPFHDAPRSQVAAIFLDAAPPADIGAAPIADERIALGTREIYVHYPAGMGRSRLKIAAAQTGTARNLATVAALASMAGAPDI